MKREEMAHAYCVQKYGEYSTSIPDAVRIDKEAFLAGWDAAKEVFDSLYSRWHPNASEVDPGSVQVIAQALREAVEQERESNEDLGDSLRALSELCDRYREALEWIAGIPQDSIIDAPEVWGHVLETARAALAGEGGERG